MIRNLFFIVIVLSHIWANFPSAIGKNGVVTSSSSHATQIGIDVLKDELDQIHQKYGKPMIISEFGADTIVFSISGPKTVGFLDSDGLHHSDLSNASKTLPQNR